MVIEFNKNEEIYTLLKNQDLSLAEIAKNKGSTEVY